ncbi:MAG: DUF1887 family protein [Clostridia bacterium]|nr:DUF1887 family protein [Clostridia bacterium]
MKTLIEFFDECQLLNIVAGVRFLPETIVFVGYDAVMTKKRRRDVERFFELRKQKVSLKYVTVERYSYESSLQVLEEIIKTHSNCCFDLTGGKELVLTAMGELSTIHQIPMVQFNPRSGRFIRVKHTDDILEPSKASLSIREDIVLNGGELVTKTEESFRWELSEEFRDDIKKMWSISRKNCTKWNQFVIALESLTDPFDSNRNLVVSANLESLSPEKQRILSDNDFFDDLSRAGLLNEVQIEHQKVLFRYKNISVKRAMSKAGNILELYVYLMAHEISEEESGIFSDIGIGVMIDWDGCFYRGERMETRNEIDVFLMRGMIPVFISCKNGEVHKEALYELDSVAQRFGGEYAKKILVTNYISSGASSRRYLIQRANDMKIEIIDSLDKLSHLEIKEQLKKAIQ